MLHMWNMFPFDPMPKEDVEFSRKFIKFLVDWAKEGKPPAYVSDWKPFSLDNPQYLVIDKEFSVKKGTPDKDRLDFWRSKLPPTFWNHILSANEHSEL